MKTILKQFPLWHLVAATIIFIGAWFNETEISEKPSPRMDEKQLAGQLPERGTKLYSLSRERIASLQP